MRIVGAAGDLRAAVAAWRREGLRIGFVPTMGNLHEGHFALVEQARERADCVVASVFVNPTQFGPGEDFERYPRTPDDDAAGLLAHGCDLLFLPDVATMYPFGADRAYRVTVPALADVLCGAHRPGHFDGVATVVARLFNFVRPDLAVFGEKDFQQLRIIERMVEDLGYGIAIVRAPTVRESDGLAMSSRNRYLSAEDRRRAAKIHATLVSLRSAWREGADLAGLEAEGRRRLAVEGFDVDYLEARREVDLGRLEPKERDGIRIFAAARIGGTRLIDNLPLTPSADK